jgi:Cu2+-containing amine oxidase
MKTVPGKIYTKKFQRRYFSYRRTNAKIMGLAQASKILQTSKRIPNKSNFSVEGNEIAWNYWKHKYL